MRTYLGKLLTILRLENFPTVSDVYRVSLVGTHHEPVSVEYEVPTFAGGNESIR